MISENEKKDRDTCRKFLEELSSFTFQSRFDILINATAKTIGLWAPDSLWGKMIEVINDKLKLALLTPIAKEEAEDLTLTDLEKKENEIRGLANFLWEVFEKKKPHDAVSVLVNMLGQTICHRFLPKDQEELLNGSIEGLKLIFDHFNKKGGKQ